MPKLGAMVELRDPIAAKMIVKINTKSLLVNWGCGLMM